MRYIKWSLALALGAQASVSEAQVAPPVADSTNATAPARPTGLARFASKFAASDKPNFFPIPPEARAGQ